MTFDSESDCDMQEDVELGLPDRSVQEYDRLDPFVCRLGGEAAWLIPREPGEICPLCSSKMFFLLQFECPARQTECFDRILYVFACNTKKCLLNSTEMSFKVFLQSRPVLDKPITKNTKASANFWEAGTENDSSVSQSIKIGQMTRCDATSAVIFPAIVLKTVDELIRPKPRIETAQSDNHEEEEFSEEEVAKDDETMELFFGKVAEYPKQCVRYCPNGKPLHFSQKYAERPFEKLCPHCFSRLVFLAQLMPAILSFLLVDKYISHIPESERGKFAPFGDGLEFATVLIYSCPVCKGPSIPTAICVELEEFN